MLLTDQAQPHAMEDTGRIREPLDPRAQAILFDTSTDRALRDEIPFYVQIDRAHVVMLVEQSLLRREHGERILAALRHLVARDYAPLRGRAAPRGTYLLYEHWLIEQLGESIGGAVHLGRSRNDINATVLRLRLRAVYRRVMGEGLRLVRVLMRQADRYAALTMPIYTHYQAALPITYGHHLAGLALALLRDLQAIEDAVREMDRCPLGAGAAGGTAVSIDCRRTSELLGFMSPVLHSVDAVAARDLVLRVLAAASILGLTLSRLATDLQMWSTAEFDLIRFPDTLVGSSSMMPQKRNAFLLEHITGRAGAPLGAFTAAAMAMHATPFSNSVAVGTEGVKPFWSALAELTDTLVLARLVIAGAQPHAGRMHARAVEGFTCATALANHLVLAGGLSFRQAHRRIGEAVRASSEHGDPFTSAAARVFDECGCDPDASWLDPAAVAAGADRGGGPAESSLRRVFAELAAQSSSCARALIERSRRWTAGRRRLDDAVAALAPHESSDGRGSRTCP